MAINPQNGLLYTSQDWYEIREYSLDEKNLYMQNGRTYTPLIRSISIDVESMAFVSGAGSEDGYNSHWYSSRNPHCQGGDFSDSGHFYYVFDLAEDNRAYTGVYVFEFDDKENVAQAKRFIPNSYDGQWDTTNKRAWELEGIDIWDLELVPLKHKKLRNQIHLIKLRNKHGYIDRVNFYHMAVDDPSKL